MKPHHSIALGLAMSLCACALDGTRNSNRESTIRKLAMAQDVATPCLSFSMQGTIAVSVSRDLLEKLAADSPRIAPAERSEQQRSAFMAGERARALLAASSGEPDRFGCRTIAHEKPIRDTDFLDSLYLLGQLMESGNAMVSDGSRVIRKIDVAKPDARHAKCPAGFNTYSAGKTQFLMLAAYVC